MTARPARAAAKRKAAPLGRFFVVLAAVVQPTISLPAKK